MKGATNGWMIYINAPQSDIVIMVAGGEPRKRRL